MRLIDADALIEAMGEEPYADLWDDYSLAERSQWLDDMALIENAPTIEPNLVIKPNEVERGVVTIIGTDIVVMCNDDYIEMMLKSEAVDDGSWERFCAEPCEDAISREDAIQAFTNYFAKGNEEHWNAIAKYVFADIPSVAPSRPSGENLRKEYSSLFECSICGASCDDTIPWSCDINFCPNCGAKMKGAGDDNNL